MSKILKIIELKYTRLEFHDRYVVSHIHEGVILNKVLVMDLIERCSSFFGANNYVYISNRIQHYNVDPTIYFDLKKVVNLKGIAIACKTPPGVNMANFEKGFCKVPFEIFSEVDDAIAWAYKKVE